MRLIDADKLKQKFIMNFSEKPEAQAIYQHLIDIVDDSPTVTLSLNFDNITEEDIEKLKIRPHGQWIPSDKISPWGNPGRSCSLCGKIVEFSENFCPKCGADMRGKENDGNTNS